MVGVLEFIEFTNLFHESFLAFLKTICLMALLYWNVLNLVLFVGFYWCFQYVALTIFSSISHSSFHHDTVGLFFVSVDALGIVLSAACSMVLTRQLCASSIAFWFCSFVVIVVSF